MTVGEFLVINDFEEVVVQSDYYNFGVLTQDGLELLLKDYTINTIGFDNDEKEFFFILRMNNPHF